jgi:hypothetical protein
VNEQVLLGGRPIEGDAFYRLTERPDLAESYRHRQGNKSMALGIGLFVMTVGVVWGLADVALSNLSPSRAPSLYPWLVAGAGLTSTAVGYAIPADPISFDERLALARAYNARVRLRPALLPSGGGLTLAGRF